VIPCGQRLKFDWISWKTRQYKDGRTWRQRTRRLQGNWMPLMEDITNAYLTWKYPTQHPKPNPTSSTISENYDFDIDIIDIFTLQRTCHIPRTAVDKTATALVRCGYIGNTPERPSFAISINTIELFRKLRLRKPSFSVEAFAKVICDCYVVCCSSTKLMNETLISYQIPYRCRYRTGLSNAFDVYLSLLRIISKQVSQVLGRNTENWRVLNSCPPCSYEVCCIAFMNFIHSKYISSKTNLL
jgi:hypothetical protein